MKVQDKNVGKHLTDILPYIDLSISELDTVEDMDIDEDEVIEGIIQSMGSRGYKDAKRINMIHNIDSPEVYQDFIFSERYGEIPEEYEREIKEEWLVGFNKYIEDN